MKKRKIFIVLLCLIWPIVLVAGVNQITDLRVQKSHQHCRLIFDTTSPIHYHQFTLAHPNRIVLDIDHTHFIRVFHRSLLTNTPVKDIRSGSHKNNRIRVVLDLKDKVNIHTFTLRPTKAQPHYRLVLDLSWKNSRPMYKTAYRPSYKVYKVSAVKNPKPIQVEPVPQRSRSIIIVIDPGHGGKDPGATGAGGTHEKTIVLKISKDLQRDINHQPGFVAYLTRKGDYYLTLRQRLAIARRYKADMFIAIHADAYRDHYAHGASVFALSQRGATSEAAHWLATHENESELMGGVDLADKTNLLKSVLINLSQTATIRASLWIGQRIIHALGNFARLHHRRVEQAAFVVLKSPDIPSLLVETGFISNPSEERKLKNPAYQKSIASALMQGIRSYFIHSPPRNTWLAAHKFNQRAHHNRYVVVRGDTLTDIAERFNVSLSSLRQLNRLRSTQLKAGQTLLIPKNI
ncbi:N-acetylmuramoyl-L-alanine amidase [Candidiatus Paracoxiella cheracis]|uniref:N-acetylmuramoyl-L-alanine amidase n=1 Tax=Candidiatus Paracoxiella cheracis TaxID=3405120 RepID=UPI003BF568E7